MMGVYIKMEMPKSCWECPMVSGYEIADEARTICSTVRCRFTNTKRPAGEAIAPDCPLVPVPPHGRLRRRIVYRGEVYNALESARINALDGILTDRYKDGFHDGLKKALEILANEVQDAPTIIPAEEGET